jgi:hypothetical protein
VSRRGGSTKAATQVYTLAASPGDNIQVSVYTVNGTYYLSLNDTTLCRVQRHRDRAGWLHRPGQVGRGHHRGTVRAIWQQRDPAPARRLRPGQLQQRDRHQPQRHPRRPRQHSLWNSYALKMVGSSGATLSAPSGLLNGTNSSGIPVSDFTAAWQAAS